MKKPVNHYVGYLTNTECVLGMLEREWGSYYESLTTCERFYLLAQVSRNLYVLFADGTTVREGVQNAATKIREEIPPDQCLKLIEALCDQLENLGGN